MIVLVVVEVVAIGVAKVDVVVAEVATGVVVVVGDVVAIAVVEAVVVIGCVVEVVALLQDDNAIAATSRLLNTNHTIFFRIVFSPFYLNNVLYLQPSYL
jgi:hypothetical protein